jgi:hypothetical protein
METTCAQGPLGVYPSEYCCHKVNKTLLNWILTSPQVLSAEVSLAEVSLAHTGKAAAYCTKVTYLIGERS